MERVAFLIEDTGERIGCLLNPDSLVIRRAAGVQPKRSVGGQLTGAGLEDDPLLFTGGSRTELELDLLIDVTLSGSSTTTEDVRDLTGPLVRLAENAAGRDGYGRIPLVRFVWGKSWNIPGVVAAVAERFERFTPSGAPERSWLRMRLLRVSEKAEAAPASQPALGEVNALEQKIVPALAPEDLNVPEDQVRVHETIGGGTDGERSSGERLDQIAAHYYGDPAMWRVLAAFNDIDDPSHVEPGRVLRIPPSSAVARAT
jgi:hypothetical protein